MPNPFKVGDKVIMVRGSPLTFGDNIVLSNAFTNGTVLTVTDADVLGSLSSRDGHVYAMRVSLTHWWISNKDIALVGERAKLKRLKSWTIR